MARFSLENDKIRIEIDSHGAELKSLVKKETGAEYMWCADTKYWGRTSPVLFPFVGNVSGKQYRTLLTSLRTTVSTLFLSLVTRYGVYAGVTDGQ